MNITNHARYRVNTRNIPTGIISMIYDNGECSYANNNCIEVYLNKKTRRKIEKKLQKNIDQSKEMKRFVSEGKGRKLIIDIERETLVTAI